jgi:uncharacterized protein YqgC (DUF456 family)
MIYLVFALAILIMLIGAAGSFLPILPGLPLILAGWILFGIFDSWQAYGLWPMVAVSLTVVACLVLDQLAGALGAKKFGAGKAGMIGTIVGALLGLVFFSLPGLILGTFLGAAIFEMVFAGKDMKGSLSAGAGAFLGFLAGSLFKFAVSLSLLAAFVFMVAKSHLF